MSREIVDPLSHRLVQRRDFLGIHLRERAATPQIQIEGFQGFPGRDFLIKA